MKTNINKNLLFAKQITTTCLAPTCPVFKIGKVGKPNDTKLMHDLLRFLLLFSILFSASFVQATTYTWTGATSSAWATTTNWSPNGNPGATAGAVVEIGVTSFSGYQPTLSVTPANTLTSITLGTATNATLTISANYTTNSLTIGTGSTVTETGAITAIFPGAGLTNNGTYTASTGTHSFSGGAGIIGGSSGVSIPTIAFNNATTNNTTLTVSTSLQGTGTLTNASTLNIGGTCSVSYLTNTGTTAVTGSGAISTLVAKFTNTGTVNLGGSGTIAGITNNASGIVNLSTSGTITSFNNATSTSTLNISTTPTVPTITTLTVSASGNTVNYSGAGNQTIKDVAYSNLTTSGSGTKTWTLAAGRAVSGSIIVGTGTNLTTAGNQTLSVAGITDVTGTLTLGGTSAKTFTGNVTINTGGAITESAVANYSFAGDLTINGTGTYTSSTGTHTFNNATADQTIGGTASTQTINAIVINKATSGSVILSHDLNTTTFTNTSGTFNPATYLLTASTSITLNGGTMRVGATTWAGNYSVTTAPAGTSTVEYYNASATINGTITYKNLSLTGGGTKTFNANTTISGNLSISSGVTTALGTGLSHTANTLTLGGYGEPSGTHGGTGSGATYINTTYFTATTGKITVSSSTAAAGLWLGLTSVWATATNWGGGAAPTSATDVSIGPGVPNQPTIGATAVCNNLSINDGATLTVGAQLTVYGTTTIGGGTSGNLTISSTAGTKIFTGLVTTVAGATWDNSSVNEDVDFRGGITNSGTFNAGSGINYFTTNDQTLTGTISIPNIYLSTNAKTLYNNGTLSITTLLDNAGSGTYTLSNALGTSVLNIYNTHNVAYLAITASASGNIVNYNGADEAIKNTTYHTLNLSGSGTKSLAGDGTIVNGDLTLNDNVSLYTGNATASYSLTLNGSLTNTGSGTIYNTFATSPGDFTLGGANTQNIAGFTTRGRVVVTKTGGTATFTSAVAGYWLYITSGTLNLDAGTIGLTHTFYGTSTYNGLDISGGVLNCSKSTLILRNSGSFTGGTFNYGTGTVEYNVPNGSSLTIAPVEYYNLKLTDSGAGSCSATFGTSTTIHNNLTLNESATNKTRYHLGMGLTHTANALYFGSMPQATGSWGGNASAATHKTYGWFENTVETGIINPLTSPEWLDHFAVSGTTSPETQCTAITGITITAQDASNNTVTNFTGTVTYGGTAGITGTSAAFTAGVLSGVSVTPTVAGNSKTFTVTNSGKTGSANFDVTAMTPPGAITSNTPQCEGTGITFSQGSCPGGTTCYWVSSATGTETNNSAATYTTATTAGTYTVWVRANNGGCWSTPVTASGTINPLPVASIKSTALTTNCAGSYQATLTSSAANTYLWSTSATTQSINVSTMGNYTVTVADINGCSATSEPIIVLR